jgi:hypothetical protein
VTGVSRGSWARETRLGANQGGRNDFDSTHFRAPPPPDPLVRADASHLCGRPVLLVSAA